MTDLRSLVDAIPELAPLDEHNQKLVNNVHPPDWVNPDPASRYNMVVIGAGTAGLVTAAGTAGLGGKVAIVLVRQRPISCDGVAFALGAPSGPMKRRPSEVYSPWFWLIHSR